MPAFSLEMFLLGCLGGLLPDALRLARERHSPEAGEYLRSLRFWIGLVILVGLGGLAAWIVPATTVLEALAYGFGAPSLISQVLGAVAATGAEPANTMARRPWRVITWWQR